MAHLRSPSLQHTILNHSAPQGTWDVQVCRTRSSTHFIICLLGTKTSNIPAKLDRHSARRGCGERETEGGEPADRASGLGVGVAVLCGLWALGLGSVWGRLGKLHWALSVCPFLRCGVERADQF